ncbi:MAG: tRNA epoxyqueuosine(34) reductase QueG [Rhizobiaceae bacterium]
MAESNFRSKLDLRARELGFDICRITPATLPEITGQRLCESLTQQHHGSMQWLENTFQRRKSPECMWHDAKSAILLGMNYGPDEDPLKTISQIERATLSVSARNRDYHDIIKGKLKSIAGWVASKKAAEVKVFVDTAPLMEKPLAEQSGLGWQGKHTNLVSREFGSWLFLGSILTNAELKADEPETDHCGTCRACLDICPTDAFPAPYQLDARKCISYLTIEHPGPVPHEFRNLMGNRIYGCDDCLAVCPWNKYAKQATEAKLIARDELKAPELAELVKLDDAAFRKMFSGSPIKRIGRNRFMRNVLIAIGNSQSTRLLPDARSHLDDPDPVVRGAAVWAVKALEDPARFNDMRESALESEDDDAVRQEWTTN